MVLVRAILRAGHRLDTRNGRVLMSAQRDREYDLCLGTWVPPLPSAGRADSPEALSAVVLDDAVRRLCHGGRLYPGSASAAAEPAAQPTTLRQTLRHAMRAAFNDDAHATQPLLIDAGFALLRRLETGIQLADNLLAKPPAASALAPLLYAAATTADGPAPGDVLASHPLLRRDVVLILSADGADGFAMGLVLNKPTGLRLGSTPLTAGRGSTVGPPPKKKATPPPPAEHWTTGRRQLTDELASQRRVRDDALSIFAEHVIYSGGLDGAGKRPQRTQPSPACPHLPVAFSSDPCAPFARLLRPLRALRSPSPTLARPSLAFARLRSPSQAT